MQGPSRPLTQNFCKYAGKELASQLLLNYLPLMKAELIFFSSFIYLPFKFACLFLGACFILIIHKEFSIKHMIITYPLPKTLRVAPTHTLPSLFIVWERCEFAEVDF